MKKSLLLLSIPLSLLGPELFAQGNPGDLVQEEEDIARSQPGPHDGGGTTTGYHFFRQAEGLDLVFKKRVLHPGSSIGYHQHGKDEIYYVQAGQAKLELNGETRMVGPGTAILVQDGDSHGIGPAGDEDLTIYIFYTKSGH